MNKAKQPACSTNAYRLAQAVADFIYNVEHSNVAGWGDCSTDVRADASFKQLKAALADAGGRQLATPKPPGVSTSASANGWDAASKRIDGELLYKADLFDYLCWLETHHKETTPELKGCDYVVLAADGTPCWGTTYADAAKVAMDYDKGVQDRKHPNR